ncbi:hypothetical protein, partial [Chryseobacterium sp. CH1]|uniref:hypothetical protein n=1 Tax=Chryseobacterium sp. CH1 TaxID=713551 RepID=UPI001E4DFAB8
QNLSIIQEQKKPRLVWIHRNRRKNSKEIIQAVRHLKIYRSFRSKRNQDWYGFTVTAERTQKKSSKL